MPVADRVISFRASDEFAERMRRARETLTDLQQAADDQVDVAALLMGEFDIAMLRGLEGLAGTGGQAAFVRVVMEALVGAAEKVRRQLDQLPAYRAFGEHDAEGDEVRRAFLAAAERVWR